MGRKLARSVRVELAAEPEDGPVILDDEEGTDVVGHGTACAGIITRSRRVPTSSRSGSSARTTGATRIVFAAGLDWAIGQGAGVLNLSLSSKSDAMFALFHDLADRASLANALLVCAANNVPGPSYPSLFASVVAVAAHDLADPAAWFYRLEPAGRVRGPRAGRQCRVERREPPDPTGNSAAAPTSPATRR